VDLDEWTGGGQVLSFARRWASRHRLVTVAAVLVVAGLLLWFVTRGPDAPAPVPVTADPSVPGTVVQANSSDCGAGWSGGTAGRQSFAVWNSSVEPVEVYLQDLRTEKVYLDVENLGIGVTRAAAVDLGPGRYAFVCLPSEGAPVHGAAQEITGAAPAHVTAGVVPITENDLAPVVATYERWVRGRLPALLAQTQRLDADVRRGDLAAAKADWLTAHLGYETLGAAYGAFGDDDEAINGLPSSTTPPATDPQLHGFHKVEAMLWTGRTDGLPAETAALVGAVRHLRADMATRNVIQPIDVGLRTHEILEDAVAQELTGYADAGSHTTLATVDADIDATWQALDDLMPLLRPRDPQLGRTVRWLHRTQALVRGFRHGTDWVPIQRLGRLERATLDADLEQAVELLSRVAVITDPRRGAQ
jgi:iron uptake system component EfeO